MNKEIFKKIVVAVGACLIILFVTGISIYVSVSADIGSEVYDLVDSSFEYHGENYMKYADIISKEDYVFLDYSRGFNDDWTENNHTFPVVIHDFKRAKAYYRYTIVGDAHGGYRIPVTISLEFRNGKWCVIDIYEPA